MQNVGYNNKKVPKMSLNVLSYMDGSLKMSPNVWSYTGLWWSVVASWNARPTGRVIMIYLTIHHCSVLYCTNIWWVAM